MSLPDALNSPYTGMGTWKPLKNPDVVFIDLLMMDMRYLAVIGKYGSEDNPLGQDTSYFPASYNMSESEDDLDWQLAAQDPQGKESFVREMSAGSGGSTSYKRARHI